MEPSEASTNDWAESLSVAGSVDDVCQRLLLWGKREGGGLARVEYSSEFDRQRVVQRLRGELAQAGVTYTEIELPTRRSAEEIVRFLRAQLAQISEGVVSVTGFATAFENGTPLADALRVVNYNREALVAVPLRQLWWMTPMLLQTSLYAMPDLHGWFRPQLQLSPAMSKQEAVGPRLDAEHIRAINFEDAHQRSRNLLAQFFKAREAGAADQDLLTTYLLPALESLAEVGAQRELRDLTLQFEGFLGSLKLGKTPEIATALDRLAGLYLDQGRYAQAEPLYLSTLEIRKSELGDHHPDTATSLNNLAGLYRSQGRYSEAELLSVEALEIRKTEHGNHHPDIANSLNSLAGLYRLQGRYSEAEPFYLEALNIIKTELGDHHLATATSLNNLAELYRSQGRYSEAEPLYVEALDISKAELGDLHPNTAASLNNLALLYCNTNRLTEGTALMIEALSILEEILGSNHPNTLTTRDSLEIIQQAAYGSPKPLARLKQWMGLGVAKRHPLR